jgi:CheY-like chemotaxis protein
MVVRTTTKELGKGTGLGLASAYGVLQQHKGWIEVESIVGSGTSFRLFLPSFVVGAIKDTTTPSKLSSTKQNKTILLVEDEPALLFISTRALNMLGYQILSATNGEEALTIWEQHQAEIDLLLTDMRMPKGMNGLELANEFWKTKPFLKIIIMSGYSMEVATDTLAGATAYTFLAKPFSVKTLSEVVQHAMA